MHTKTGITWKVTTPPSTGHDVPAELKRMMLTVLHTQRHQQMANEWKLKQDILVLILLTRHFGKVSTALCTWLSVNY
jgi:hypothetical protein